MMDKNKMLDLMNIPVVLPDDRLETAEQTERYIKTLEAVLPDLRQLLTVFRKEGK